MSNVMGPDSARERETAFEQLVLTHQTALLRTCYMYLRDQQLAEDAVQDTFVKAYRSMHTFRGESSERTWLIKIAMNTCRDLYRTGWYRFMDRRFTPDMLPEAGVPFEEHEEILVTAVMRLPVKLREVILLYYYQGMNINEIADSLRLKQSSVSGRLKRAREKLRKILEGGDFDV